MQFRKEELEMKRQLTVRLTDELEEQVEALARKLNRKRSDVVRLALERFIQEADEAHEDRPYSRVKDLIGSVESGIADLGSSHREHLKSRFSRDA
jgi:predicted DNA-binding protein